jgi:hypothetical protein
MISLFDDNDGPAGDGWSKWAWGVVAPLLIAIFGASRFYFQQFTLGGGGQFGSGGHRMLLTGYDAIAMGIASIAVALFLHSRYFLSDTKRFGAYADLGKVISLVVGIVAIGFVVVRNSSPL